MRGSPKLAVLWAVAHGPHDFPDIPQATLVPTAPACVRPRAVASAGAHRVRHVQYARRCSLTWASYTALYISQKKGIYWNSKYDRDIRGDTQCNLKLIVQAT